MRKKLTDVCKICNKEKIIISKKHYVCRSCFRKNYQTRKLCVICKKPEPVEKNTKDGPICKNCYSQKQPKKKCVFCGKLKRVQFVSSDGAVCPSCYRNKYQLKKECIFCCEKRIVEKNTKDGPVCRRCYKKIQPKKKCVFCEQKKTVEKNTKDGPICKKCYSKIHLPKEMCIMCKKTKFVNVRNTYGTVCHECRIKERAATDDFFSLKRRLRKVLLYAFKKYSQTGKIKPSKKYGIDYQAIIEYLGPCPGDRDQYHIDHIIPLSAFDFNDPIHIRAAFAPENHQWLTVKENLQKSAKYKKEDFNNYISKFY